ncbi:DUF1906 domain-containing protein [Mumia sp. zg.B53]|uniref:glycoside hydrolase domain-containing protein n=1 Tax=unclassified Mumia TaxID=2621872 RepID=UPI001C6E6A73|nr:MULTISPECIES: glycoside hydrolase domain-containing protein [unclassified Mumia]MBW9207293.1 DUF1906 domain-containing protein [Mumia sp. zg.B17]MBW9214977.1 DUF1906 domain-containing protein [Mumia sp. zg.B53]
MSTLASRLRGASTRRIGAAATGLALAAGLLAPALAAAPASAVEAPGSFTGFAFDACTAPTQAQMDAWWVSSPYAAVGVYISGSSRACAQPALTRSWVTTQARRGWRLLPLHVGRQAPCYSGRKQKMSINPTTARAQGVAAANESVASAKALGIGRKRVLYLDIEAYSIANSACNTAVVSFVDGWGSRLAQHGYRSGLYSSASAAIAAMNRLRVAQVDNYHYPNHLWFGWYNGKANLAAEPYLDDRYWARGKRIHQYVGNRVSRYNGVAINIDRNYLDVGAGSRATKPRAQCGTHKIQRYRALRPQQRRPTLTPAAKCLLRQNGYFKGSTRGPVHGAKSQRAVKRFQAARGWKQTGVVSRRTWVALLSNGKAAPVLKRGSNGKHVYRLQRSLTAALGRPVPRNGLFDATTQRAVVAYRTKVKLPRWATAEPRLWASLRAGRR